MSAAKIVVTKGTCYALYAYDVGLSIDLDAVRRLVSAGLKDQQLRHNRRAPKYFDYRPAPLLITQEVDPPRTGPFQPGRGVDFLLYDFGAVSVGYRIPIAGSLEALREISCTLGQDTRLQSDSRQRLEALLKQLRRAVSKPHLADCIEDYAVFQIEEFSGAAGVGALHEVCPQELAQILRAESSPLSEQEVTDALACRLSFSREDVTFIDWSGAIAFDREADDVRAVLEFANVELLEMRFLDRQLDDALDRSYETISRDSWLRSLLPGRRGAASRRVSRMQVDGAILFERVTNAPKLLGDQYLARLYRLASQRFHLPEWNTAALRKLDAIETIYEQMHDRAATRRLEVLEWIIILLIALEIVLSFNPGGIGR
jgi:hypothetical protein